MEVNLIVICLSIVKFQVLTSVDYVYSSTNSNIVAYK